MRIAIDYTAATRQAAGISNYVRSLVDAMLAQDTTNQYTLLTSGRPPQDRPFPDAKNVRGRSLVIPDRYLNILWYRWRLPLSATFFTGQVDLYHGPDFVLPPLNGKLRKIVTVHDLAFLEHPEYAVAALAAHLKKVVPEAVAAADAVVAVSGETRRALVEQFATPPQKITLVPNGIRSSLKRVTNPILLEAARHKYGLKSPLVLGVGTLEPRKNHLGLIKAFHKSASSANKQARPAMLAIAGGEGWMYEETRQAVADLKLEKKVRFLGRVSDLDLMLLYSLADVFVFPSFYEGFGVPPIEAMACGAPVITSNVSSLPEVVGDAALLVDPHNNGAIAQAILRVLGNPQQAEELRQKGYERAQRFTWAASARKMLSIYARLYAGKTTFDEEVTETL
ncbi:MAG TPA: glycosyltransferase family 1 protein [Ktedonobacteraceae bacterium]|nr:glycosyltransferase family 1 protein [Ktedonobacteraceae bacterium]